MAILISKWTSFRAKNISSGKGCHYLMIKRSVNQEDKTVLNICAPNNRITKMHTRKTDRAPRRNSQIFSISWRFQYPSLNIENHKDIVDLNNTVNQLDLINVYGLSHITTAEYSSLFFLSAHRTVSMMNHNLGHKTSLGNLK